MFWAITSQVISPFPNSMFDYNQINSIVSGAFEATADAYAQAQIEAIQAEVYPWDGTVTYRKSGEIVSEPRNAWDTGELGESLVQLKGIGLRLYLYLAAHAAEVHEGYETANGNSKPARPWTKVAREMFIDLEMTMADELRKRL